MPRTFYRFAEFGLIRNKKAEEGSEPRGRRNGGKEALPTQLKNHAAAQRNARDIARSER